MSLLNIYDETGGTLTAKTCDGAAIAEYLHAIGVVFERWAAASVFADDADSATVLAAYADPVARLQGLYGFQSADVINVGSEHPQKAEIRAKFLNEHTHSDFEVRFFVQGRGLFFLHVGAAVYAVLCEAGDLLSVPAGVPHWFDMGAEPNLKVIRLFTTPDGWVADFTGSDIARRFPTLEQFVEANA